MSIAPYILCAKKQTNHDPHFIYENVFLNYLNSPNCYEKVKFVTRRKYK